MARIKLNAVHNVLNRQRTTLGAGEVLTKEQAVPLDLILLHDLEDTIARESERSNLSSMSYKPSSLKCPRQMYYQVIGFKRGEIKEEQAPNLVGICETGTHRHEDIEKYIMKLNKYGYKWEYLDVAEFIKERNLTDLEVLKKSGCETKVFNKKLNMTFLTDGLLRYTNNNGETKTVIFEYKTETSRKFYNRVGIAPEHIPQGVAYSINFGLDEEIFIYENRDTCEKKAFTLKITEDMRNEMLEKIKKVDDCIATKTLPPKSTDTSPCRYCIYSQYCRRDINAD